MAENAPVGEDAWLALVDEASRSAGTLEQRVGVVELYNSALTAEPWSTKLWLAYCEWFWSLHTDCQTSDAGWPEEEQLVGQEMFSLEEARQIWQQGAQAIQWRMNDSHEVWNRWISIELEELSKGPTEYGIERVRKIFEARLQIPHATWDDTSQMFTTSFISKYDDAAYFSTMEKMTELAKTAKELCGHREMHELKLQQATDDEARKTAMKEYLDWEDFNARKKNKKGMHESPAILCVALYERALSSGGLGLDTSIWEDYITFLSLAKGFGSQIELPTILSVAQRATAHCPWHGPLWTRYLLSAETDGLQFVDIEKIKHTATSTGKLDRDGMGAVLDVYATWCGYLRRRAVDEASGDEEADMAEMGLHAALEDVRIWGERLYGKKAWKGDPSFRIERVQITYLTHKGSIEEARSIWNLLTKTHSDSYEFWQQYYLWEMTVRSPDDVKHAQSSLATAVLAKAAQRKTLDWPEKILEVYVRHCNNYEDAQTARGALDTTYRASKNIARRRQKEADAASALYTQQQPQEAVESTGQVETSSTITSKRKRDSASEEVEGTTPKKVKNEQPTVDESSLQEQHLKRDRENTTVLVTNLPAEVTQTKVRQYFKEYGHINSLTIKTEVNKSSSTGLIEFGSTDDVQSALLRDGKYFGEKQIHVEAGTGLTLYVTNYPPTADEAFFRELFKDCGDIFSIRWPSLKFNTQRRFCYISFRSRDAAAAATRLDGKLLENRYKLQAKYSDPARKKPREGATAEGREVHVSGLDTNTTEDELKEVFSKYGTVSGVRILRKLDGRSKGAGFVDFAKKEDAEKASEELNGIKFKTQIIKVELSKAVNFKPTATTGKGSSASPAPDADGDSAISPSPAPDISHTNTHALHGPSKAEIAGRTITLMNIPDTVNDARVRALVEPYGPIVKLSLRLDHSGAIVEFADVKDAGRAALGLENHEIVPGRRLRTGGMKDLFQQKDETRTDRIQVGQGKKESTSFMQPSAPVRRPGAGGRGGLGAKKGLGFSAAKAAPKPELPSSSATNGNGEGIKPKSNADFKKMFLSGGTE